MKLPNTGSRRRPKAVVASLLAVTLSSALVACSSGVEGDGDGQGTEASEGESAGDSLLMWHYAQEPSDEFINRLNVCGAEAGVTIDDVAIKYEDYLGKILQGAAAGALPDLMLIDNPWNSSMAAQGVLEDLTDRVDEWGEWDNYYDGPAKSATWEDKIYGVPDESNALIMYYDKTLFDAEGVAVPTTWEEFGTVAAQLTTPDRYGFATSMVKSENSVFVYESLLWQNGADLDSLRSPEALEATQFLADLVDSGTMSSEALSWDLRGGITELVNGRAAIAWSGTWDYRWAAENMPEGRELGVAVLPAGPKGEASNLGGENWAITTTSEHKDQAWDVIKCAVTPEVQVPFLTRDGQLPSRRDLASLPEFQEDPYPVFLDQLEVANARVYGPNYPQMADALVTLFQSVLSDQATPDEALERAADTIEPLLAN